MTEATIFNSMAHDVNTNQTRAYTAQRQVSTGRRVLSAEDDPIAAARSSLLSASISSLDTMGRVAAIAESQLASGEGAINDAQGLLARARELAVMGANGSRNAEERGHIAQETRVLQQAMVSIANTNVGGTYIFAGTAGVEPFVDDGTYRGDALTRQVDVGPGIRIRANVPGDSVFNVTDGVNIIGLLGELTTALETNSPQGVYDVIEKMDPAIDQLNSARSLIGGALTEIQISDTQRTDLNILLHKDRSDSTEVDQADALVRMMQAQTAYQTALAEAARVLSQMQNNPLMR